MLAALTRFSLTSADAEALAAFYEAALGCRRLQVERREGRNFEQLMNVRGGACAVTLTLGAQTLELLQFDAPGQAYPSGGSASDLNFQHFAILVTDMQQAFRQLAAVPGWTAISREGPQRLPQSSGGVTAFKFRDPEGHPLELLAQPVAAASHAAAPGLWCGIDHSAISVSDTMQSVAFYEELGLRLSATSYNHGIEQARLDDVSAPNLEVTALSPLRAKPHLELLCYRRPRPRSNPIAANNDVIATRLVLQREVAASPTAHEAVHRVDPDGHHLIIE
ncbi:MAG TPA: VOC family protein [Steroidobacteraceae bacterium]|jgi:catechol 2,3-dioxygenase-like lactoylglutathione lyase family enzyme|nr:VOC family protein [Steroidobacteraceae bacterium]